MEQFLDGLDDEGSLHNEVWISKPDTYGDSFCQSERMGFGKIDDVRFPFLIEYYDGE